MRSSSATEDERIFLWPEQQNEASGDKMKRLWILVSVVTIFFSLFFAGQVLAKTVTLSWDASPSNVTGYKIYYNDGSSQAPLLGSGADQGASPVDAGNALTFTLTGLPDDQVHYFAVVAYDASGNESTYSNVVESPVVASGGGGGVSLISKAGWSLHYVDSEDLQIPRPAIQAFDGDVNTMWHTQWTPSHEALPHEIQIDLGAVHSISGFRYLPRQDGGINGTIADYEFYVSSDGSNWGSPVATGTFANSTDEKEVTFSAVTASYVRLRALREVNGNVWSSMAELNLLKPAIISNNAPVLAAIGAKSILEGANTSFTISASDADGDSLTYSASNLPTGAGFNSSTGSFSWTPGFDQAGSYSVTFAVFDGSATDSEVVTITVGNVNRSPVLGSIGAKSVAETNSLNFTIAATDPDNDNLSYSASNLPTGAAFNSSTRAFSWTPTAAQAGSYTVTFSVSDGAASDSEAVTITVAEENQPPVLTAVGNRTGAENSAISFTLSATDADGDSLSYSATNLPSGANLNPTSGAFSWTPDYSQAGSYNLTFSVSDGTLSDAESISISVSDVNRAPLLAEIGTQTVAEGVSLSFTISGFDPDDDGLTYSATDLPTGANFNAVTRQFSWIPPFETTENTRIYPVTFSVTDGVLSDSETVTINVTNVNRAPVLDAIGPQNLTEGDSFNLVVSASDPDNNALTYSAANVPSGAVFTPSTRSLSWIPTTSQAGTYNVTFAVSDGLLSDSQTVALNVANLNQAPVLDAIGSQTVNEGIELILNISANDPENDSLTFSASGLPEGASFDAAQSRFSWTPDFTQAGSFTVTFNVTDDSLSDSETVTITVVNSNQSPTIAGTPATSVMAKTSYSFTPTATDPDGDALTFSITNKPSWASFDTTTGRLSGNPTELQVGTTAAIAIGASDGNSIVFLPLFDLEVLAYVPVDSDADGVLDHMDAFPNDGSEWLDTDGDLIGNNADTDDDNDGVADIRDGAPLDSSRSGWVISASASNGGFITPEGDTEVLYGGSQAYTLTPMAGYYIDDLLVDNVSIGKVVSYQFDNISTHHTIEAVFAAIPTGLSVDPTEAGLAGVERIDGGDDSNNLVSGSPKLDLDYRFKVTMRENVSADLRRVFLILDGYRYQMQLDEGGIASGATYSYTTRLGPAYAHSFYYLCEDNNNNPLWRYPATGTLPGPRVELLDGKNVIGTPGDIDIAGLDSIDAFNVVQAYRWVPADRLKGSYEKVDSSGAVKAGEGYVLKRTLDGTLPSLDGYGEITTATYDVQVQAGWNLIANPYKGNIDLADVQVKVGSNNPLPWLTAAADNILVDGIYYYLGVDWGNVNAFENAGGSQGAVLVPWIGYWIYVNPVDQPVTLIFSRPQQ
jgi:hypothetical protein